MEAGELNAGSLIDTERNGDCVNSALNQAIGRETRHDPAIHVHECMQPRNQACAPFDRIEIARQKSPRKEPLLFDLTSNAYQTAVTAQGSKTLRIELDLIEAAGRTDSKEIAQFRDALSSKLGTEPRPDVEPFKFIQSHLV